MQNYEHRQTTSSTSSKQKKGTSTLRRVLEGIFLIGWLFCTGVAGYFIGHTQKASSTVQVACPPVVTSQAQATLDSVKPPCIPRKKVQTANAEEEEEEEKGGEGEELEGGYTLSQLERMWTCSHAQADPDSITQVNQQIYPKENNLDKTKWKSILTVEPKAFFDKYLSQYPGDTRATQPVVIFSHKPLTNFADIDDVCKVIDVAIVPDEPGVCVAVTETFHDVASYHMLHADKQSDGTFALTSNSIEGRVLPEEEHYAMARALLLDFFTHTESVDKAIKMAPKFANNQIAVGVLITNEDELELFRNSIFSAERQGVSKSKFVIFTVTKSLAQKAGDTIGNAVRAIAIPELKNIGSNSDVMKGEGLTLNMKRHFIQAWLAFSVAASGNKMLWQSPGTIWFTQPDDLITNSPVVETIWAYKGRNDIRAAPFFNSLDFFVATGAERSVHLLHEIVLHFDLVLAWKSLDALTAYRLAENNARYGTTTHLLPPHEVLHTELMGHSPVLLKDAVSRNDDAHSKKQGTERHIRGPKVIVVPSEGMSSEQAKTMLLEAGLWYL